jgi:K+-transporting ATPase ATPase B chain
MLAGARSRSGCGSPCCSPISPKPSPKAAARRRPIAAQDPHRDRGQAAGRSPPGAASIRRSRHEQLKVGDVVLVEAGDIIPSDGEVIEGVASVDEAPSPANPRRSSANPAATARPSPAARRCCPTGSRCASPPQGSTFLDRMIALVEGAERQKTPNEIALNILLAGLTIIFVFAVRDHPEPSRPMPAARSRDGAGRAVRLPDPDHHRRLLSAIGIAGMDRLVRFNVLAMSGRAVEARATSTRCCSTRPAPSRSATARRPSSLPRPASPSSELADAAQLASLADETPEGRSHRRAGQGEIRHRGRDGRRARALRSVHRADRMSGVDAGGIVGSARARSTRSAKASRKASAHGPRWPLSPKTPRARSDRADASPPAARRWPSPRTAKLLGVIHLKDIVKGGIRERFAELRRWASAR